MEVISSFTCRQLGPGVSTDITPRCLFGPSTDGSCGTEASINTAQDTPNTEDRENLINWTEDEVKLSGGIIEDEKNSDLVEKGPAGTKTSPSREKERSQISYLLNSIPILNEFFEIKRKIGEGTFSSVFLATLKSVPSGNPSANRQFAIKHLIPTTHPTRAERELRCLQEIGGSNNVVGVYFCLRNRDNISFVMPYLPHRRFSEYVLDMGVQETRLYMKNLLLALCRVHSFNIIHRDVKPSNFLYDRPNKQFLLVDFGLSQPVEETAIRRTSEPPALSSSSRKRKREKDGVEVGKENPTSEVLGNVSKRQALAPYNTNVLSYSQSLEKMKLNADNSRFVANQRIIQNSVNVHIANGVQSNILDPNALKGVTHSNSNKMSPLKCDTNNGRRTPSKIKNSKENSLHPPFNEEFDTISDYNKTLAFGPADIYKDSYKANNALDLCKVKNELEVKRNAMNAVPRKGSLMQRKILFDDKPEISNIGKETLKEKYNDHNFPHYHSKLYGKSTAHSSTVSEKSIAFKNNGEFHTLVPEQKESLSAASVVRVQNSRVLHQKSQQKVVFAKPQAPPIAGAKNRLNTTQTPSPPQCNCYGRPQVCTICLARKPQNAPRAGTPGFRPPEVLLRSPMQTTAVDMWAVGVILLCILSGCYPFFRSPDDLSALAEIMTIFGTDSIRKIAIRLGRLVVCSQHSRPMNLKKLCALMRQRQTDISKGINTVSLNNSPNERCKNCCQRLSDPDACICLKEEYDPLAVILEEINNKEEADNVFPDSAFHLLARLLDLNPETRISAAQALEHPFVVG